MRLGIHRLLDSAPVGKRLGLVTHPAAVLPDLTLGLDALLAAGQPVVAVFGAEHGLRGTGQAGESEDATVDEVTGLPVYDTYRHGFADALADSGIDVLLVDLQHVGARFYTYESTLYDAIAAAAAAGVRIHVLDRPNPAGGVEVGGPVLNPEFASFVGRAPIPMRHGLTMGELARLFASLHGAPVPEVATMDGWTRSRRFDATGLPWVPPSPNLPTAASALTYLGTCLFEGTNLSVGRGTTTPFEVVGAPFLDRALVEALRAQALAGTAFRECAFTPAFDVHAGERLPGLAVHVLDADAFDPIRTALTMLTTIAALYPGALEFRESAFDRLCGDDAVRKAICAGASADEIISSWSPGLISFEATRDSLVLY
ncbi:MAG TPA: DUF1343 domain-containing protein [Micromonosporaceae bacterium]|jgi:uncharacterized protein YbbC (DUF1343 family)